MQGLRIPGGTWLILLSLYSNSSPLLAQLPGAKTLRFSALSHNVYVIRVIIRRPDGCMAVFVTWADRRMKIWNAQKLMGYARITHTGSTIRHCNIGGDTNGQCPTSWVGPLEILASYSQQAKEGAMRQLFMSLLIDFVKHTGSVPPIQMAKWQKPSRELFWSKGILFLITGKNSKREVE